MHAVCPSVGSAYSRFSTGPGFLASPNKRVLAFTYRTLLRRGREIEDGVEQWAALPTTPHITIEKGKEKGETSTGAEDEQTGSNRLTV